MYMYVQYVGCSMFNQCDHCFTITYTGLVRKYTPGSAGTLFIKTPHCDINNCETERISNGSNCETENISNENIGINCKNENISNENRH